MPSGRQKEIATLRRMVQARGYKVAPSGSGHWKILDKNDKPVVDGDGPIILSGTSSEIRARSMSVKRLLEAGVLLVDPWAPQKPKSERDGDSDGRDERDEREEREREAAAERQRTEDFHRSERTRQVRERLEPLVVLLGGWDKRGMLRELGTVAHYVAERQGLQVRWHTPAAASDNADGIRKGATLSPSMAEAWERFLNELEAWPDIVARYMMLLREAKGLAEPSIGHDWEKLQTSVPAQLPQATEAASGQRPALFVGSLALELAYEMGVGRSDSLDKPRAMQLLLEVLQLEAEARGARAREGDADDQEDDLTAALTTSLRETRKVIEEGVAA